MVHSRHHAPLAGTVPTTEASGPAYRALDTLVGALLAYAALMAFLGVFVLAARSLAPGQESFIWIGGTAVSLSALFFLWKIHRRTKVGFDCLSIMASVLAERSWLWVWLASGISLRLLLITAFPGTPVSDGATYIVLARKLIAGEPYAVAGTLAYWPPGYPFFLAPWLAVIQSQRVAIVASNLILFVVGALGVWFLVRRILTTGSARIALALFAVWPNLAFLAGMPEKEQLLVTLLPWIVLLAIVTDSRRTDWWKLFLGGLLLGAATLVQPIFQLFPLILLCYWVVCHRNLGTPLRMLCLTIVGMALVIGPWTIRNYRVFDQFVLVSTNGGWGIYGANNPKATGGYLELDKWPDDLLSMPELQADHEGKRRAMAWMVANPARFLVLAFEKDLRFMGEDATGPYVTMKRGGGSASAIAYVVAKIGSNLFWLGVWSSILCGLFVSWSAHRRIPPHALLIPFAFIYFFIIHTFVESSGKYHVVTIGILCVLLPLLLESPPEEVAERDIQPRRVLGLSH